MKTYFHYKWKPIFTISENPFSLLVKTHFHFPKQALKLRGEHIQKYLYTLFLRDYAAFTKNGSVRHDHTKFEAIVKKVLNKKIMDAEVQKALKDKEEEDKKARGIFGMFGWKTGHFNRILNKIKKFTSPKHFNPKLSYPFYFNPSNITFKATISADSSKITVYLLTGLI